MDRRQVYGGPRPPFSSLSVVHVHRVHVRVAGKGNSPASSPGVLPPVVSSPANSHSGASAQLRWEKLRQASANAVVGSRWRPGLPRALATVVGGLVVAVLAGGAARGCSTGSGCPVPIHMASRR